MRRSSSVATPARFTRRPPSAAPVTAWLPYRDEIVAYLREMRQMEWQRWEASELIGAYARSKGFEVPLEHREHLIAEVW